MEVLFISYVKVFLCNKCNSRRVTRVGEGGRSALPFLKIGKKCPNLEKKFPDYGHL